MSEKIREQISAFVDGELPANEVEFLVHRLSRDTEIHRKALAYRTIGAAIRGELLDPHPDQLRRRILNALDGESLSVESAPRIGWDRRRLTRPAIGLAVAATVAVMAIVSLRNVARDGDGPVPAPLVAEVGEAPAPSYVVPQEPADAGLVRVPIRLTNYLVNHGEYASSLGRKSIHSDIVGYGSRVENDEDVSDRGTR